MRLSPHGRSLIKGFEGLSLKAYPDTSKGYSIGYGHFGAKKGDVITREQADALFDGDVAKYELAVSTTTPRALQHEFDAMVSLAYNIGTAGFSNSTVARLHNAGDKRGAADAFRMWKKADGADSPVLMKRREKERDVYLEGHPELRGAYPLPPEPLETASTDPHESPTWPPPDPVPLVPTTPGWTAPEDAPSWHLSAPTRAAPALTLAALGLGWLLYRLIHR